LVGQLVGSGAEVTILSFDRQGKSKVFTDGLEDKINIVYGDVSDYKLVSSLLGFYKVNFIFHLAARAVVVDGQQSPLDVFETNIRGTWNLLEAARSNKSSLESIVVASSEKSYGSQNVQFYDENLPLLGRYPYDVSKSCADLIGLSFFSTYSLPVAIARFSNIFGPGDQNFSRLVPGTIQSLLKNEAPVIKSDGKSIKSLLYVKDAVEGLLLLAENKQSSSGQAFNFAAKETFSVKQIVEKIISTFGSNLEPVVKAETISEHYTPLLSSRKAESSLNWSPKYNLIDGLEEAIPWYREHFGETASFLPGSSDYPIHPIKTTTIEGKPLSVSDLPVVLFCGGSGARLREETHNKPKPMVDVGGKPLLWHVIKIYRHYGFRKFILTLGHKGEYVKEYFSKDSSLSDCDINMVDTGESTPTGGRLLKCAQYIDTDLFMCNYGDGVSDLNVLDVLESHRRQSGLVGTITGVRVPHKWGIISFSQDGKLKSYSKGHLMNEPINAGFMVFSRQFLEYLDLNMMVEDPFNRLGSEGKLAVHFHNGYFFAVDTYRDLEELNQTWENKPPWKVWLD